MSGFCVVVFELGEGGIIIVGFDLETMEKTLSVRDRTLNQMAWSGMARWSIIIGKK